jgi:hypothetical protein
MGTAIPPLPIRLHGVHSVHKDNFALPYKDNIIFKTRFKGNKGHFMAAGKYLYKHWTPRQFML